MHQAGHEIKLNVPIAKEVSFVTCAEEKVHYCSVVLFVFVFRKFFDEDIEACLHLYSKDLSMWSYFSIYPLNCHLSMLNEIGLRSET